MKRGRFAIGGVRKTLASLPAIWPDKMPELEFMNVPNLCNYIRMMNSSEEIEEYLRTENIGYNPSIPDVFMGIVFDKYPARNV